MTSDFDIHDLVGLLHHYPRTSGLVAICAVAEGLVAIIKAVL